MQRFFKIDDEKDSLTYMTKKNITDEFFINSFGDNPASNKRLQPHLGFLLANLIKQNNLDTVIKFLENNYINNAHEFITADVYRAILEKNNHLLLVACHTVLKNSNSEKHKALLSYELIEKKIQTALQCYPSLMNKIMSAWTKINMEELVVLNIFLQFYPTNDDIAHYFKGGLFAIQDGGKLKAYFTSHLAARDRSHDCSHSSITPAMSTQGKFIPEFLFGDRNIFIKDNNEQIYSTNTLKKESYTWFQTEFASLFGESLIDEAKNLFTHKLCFVVYKYTNKNVGPYGCSEFKEGNIRILNTLKNKDYGIASSPELFNNMIGKVMQETINKNVSIKSNSNSSFFKPIFISSTAIFGGLTFGAAGVVIGAATGYLIPEAVENLRKYCRKN